MIQKVLAALTASIRDIVLAGIAAAVGYIIGTEVLPNNLNEYAALFSGALYAGLRAAVAFAVTLIAK